MKSSNEMTNISARLPAKKKALMWLMKTSAKVNCSSIFCHKSYCNNRIVDCFCCTKFNNLNTSWHEQL